MSGGPDDQDAGRRSDPPQKDASGGPDASGRGTDNVGSAYFKALGSAGPMLGAGIQFAASVILMFFLGKWGDDEFGTAPWLMLCGLAFGFAAGMVAFIKAARRASEEAGGTGVTGETRKTGSKGPDHP